MVKTNSSTLHMIYDKTRCDTTRRTATTKISPEGIGCQKQTAPRFCQHPIRWTFTSHAFTRWRHLSTHAINRPATNLSTPQR